MIVLTAEEADKVRGRSPKDATAALAPVALKDGRFILGDEVLDDPAHEDVRDFLASLPREPLEKLPVYTAEDLARQPIAEDTSWSAVTRRDKPDAIDEAKPDTLATIDVDGEPRKPA